MRPIPFALKSLVRKEINEQLKAGIIRHSKSKYASPLHVVHKSDGRVRLTVDYKLLNAAIESAPYPLPNIQDLFMKLSKSNWFSTFDLLKVI